ncbi:MAG: HAMP domain-containing protein [Leptospiraceae bacterium]|nr:HAMP domain-containing protein [Leptospiraceae bacterium]
MQEKKNPTNENVSNFLSNFLQKGGIRLRLTLIFSLLFLGMIAILSSTIITIQGNSLKNKSFEVCESIEIGLSASARESISTDSLITLRDVLKNIQKADISGLVRVDVFSINRQKKKRDEKDAGASYKIVASSQDGRENLEPGKEALEYIAKSKENEKLQRYESVNDEKNSVFIFVKPVHVQIAGTKKWIGTIYIEYLESEITEASKKAIWISSLISFLVLIVAIFIIYRMGANIAAPILQIADASKQVGEGNFSVQLNIHTNDELEKLSKDFNSMVKGLNEKIKMEKFVSK